MSQRNVYLSDAAMMQAETTVVAARSAPNGYAVAVQDNLHRPAGGGEPADRGRLILNTGATVAISRVEKADGFTWLILQGQDHAVSSGSHVLSCLDIQHRNRKRELHTLIHGTLAVAVRSLPGLSVETADIAADASEALVVGSWSSPVTDQHVADIDREVRSIVLQARPVSIEKAKSIDHARKQFGSMFRLSDRHQLSGRVRLVVIKDLDANPCSGCHFETTKIGAFEMIRHSEGDPNKFAVRLRRTGCWMYWYGHKA
jgi:Ser-tRNA(Ala) deacylase AlaX